MSSDVNKLISDLAEGNINALEELYSMLSIRIFNYAKTITQNKELAEDITQDVFLQIHKEAMRISKIPDPAAYIMVITRNHAYNLIRRNSRTISSIDNAIEISDNSSPYDSLLIKDAFSKLPLNQRETIHLKLICGYSFKEIAKLQNTPTVTVKWRYSKAISQLKAYFTQDIKEENCNERI